MRIQNLFIAGLWVLCEWRKTLAFTAPHRISRPTTGTSHPWRYSTTRTLPLLQEQKYSMGSPIDAEIISTDRPKSRWPLLRRATDSIRSWMQRVRVWQRTQRRSLFLAAAMAFSVLLVSSQHLDRSSSTMATSMNQQSATSIERVVRAPLSARGGSDLPSGLLNNKVVEEGVAQASRETGRTLREAAQDLLVYMEGPKSDTLLLLLATALITPLCQKLKTSPILGFFGVRYASWSEWVWSN